MTEGTPRGVADILLAFAFCSSIRFIFTYEIQDYIVYMQVFHDLLAQNLL